MSCDCAPGLLDCIPRPSLTKMCCPKPKGCCSPRSIDVVPDDCITAFEAGETLTEECQQYRKLLEGYRDALEVALKLIASRVCMARYAGGCCVVVRGCTEARCCSSCCGSCRQCDAASLDATTLEECVKRDQIASISDGWKIRNGRTMRLYGPVSDCGGEFEFKITLKPLCPLFTQAWLRLACELLPCADSCGRDRDTVSESNDGITRSFESASERREAGLLGSWLADELERDCHRSTVRFGRRDPITDFEFVSCEAEARQ